MAQLTLEQSRRGVHDACGHTEPFDQCQQGSCPALRSRGTAATDAPECDHDWRENPYETLTTNPPQKRDVCARCGLFRYRTVGEYVSYDQDVTKWPKVGQERAVTERDVLKWEAVIYLACAALCVVLAVCWPMMRFPMLVLLVGFSTACIVKVVRRRRAGVADD